MGEQKTDHDTNEVPPTQVQERLLEQVGRYRVESLLGRGGFGTVYRGFDPELGRSVAIKISHNEKFASRQAQDLFLHEARAVARLDHPHVVPVYDVGLQNGGCYIVYRLIDGQSLAARMHAGKVPYEQVAAIAAQVAEAIGFAHQANLYHRDIKPSNILLDRTGDAYVADFGLAVREEELIKERGTRSGTVAYMSPEQLRGEGHLIDGRADIYSLGVVLYELVSGQRPFQGESADSVVEQILHRDPRPPRQINPGIPVELERVCLKAMNKSISERYAAAGDMAADLRLFALTSGAGVASAPQLSRHDWRHGLIESLAVSGLLVVSLFAANAWWGTGTNGRGDSRKPPMRSSEGPSGGVEQGVAAGHTIPSGTLRVQDFQVSYIRSDPDGDRQTGVLGRDVWLARQGDAVRLAARLSRPAYAYLLALRADGLVELCWPRDEAAPPPLSAVALYPTSSEPNVMYGLDEGTGLWAFVILASDDALPAYQDWRKSHTPPPWAVAAGRKGTVWRLSAEGIDQVPADLGMLRGKGRLFRGVEPLEEIVTWSKAEAKIDALEGIAFTAEPRR